MSNNVPQETLMSIPTDELLYMHSKLPPSGAMSNEELTKYMMRAPFMFFMGCRLESSTTQAGWDPQFPVAIRSGWNRLALSTLDWLSFTPPTVDKVETRVWLRDIPPGFISIVIPEEESLTDDNADVDTVAGEAEAAIQDDFPAFAALSSSLEANLFERGWGIKEAEVERLGAALAGLAIKRQLSKVDVTELEELYLLSVPPAQA